MIIKIDYAKLPTKQVKLTDSYLANEEEADAIYLLAQASYPFGSPWTQQQFVDDVLSSQSIYLCLYEKTTLIAFLSFRLLIDQIEIDHVVVDEKWQNQKIAQQLCQQLVNLAQANQVEAIFLEVRQSNAKALAVYQKMGFEQMAIRKAYYHHPLEDAQIMRKMIRKVD